MGGNVSGLLVYFGFVGLVEKEMSPLMIQHTKAHDSEMSKAFADHNPCPTGGQLPEYPCSCLSSKPHCMRMTTKSPSGLCSPHEAVRAAQSQGERLNTSFISSIQEKSNFAMQRFVRCSLHDTLVMWMFGCHDGR